MNTISTEEKAIDLLCDIIKEYTVIMFDESKYETHRNSEAEAVCFLAWAGRVEILKGNFPETKFIQFKFI